MVVTTSVRRSSTFIMDTQTLIELLKLERHREGGYFRRTYASKMTVSIAKASHSPSENDPNSGVQRSIMTSIFYLLTREAPTMHMNLNRSDIVHYFHLGSPVEFFIIPPTGELIQETLGADILSGEKLQLLIPGGCWRAATMKETGLANGQGFSLTSEAVAPGFDYDDNTLAKADDIRTRFPHLWDQIQTYVYPDDHVAS